MKKGLSIALALVLTLSSAVPVFADDGINVIVNGKKVSFSDQAPVIKNDRVLVPLRGVLEEMGIEVNWNEFDKSVSAQRGLAYAQFTIGDSTMLTDSEEVTLDVPPEIINERTMIPLRAIAEAFDASVEWDGNTKTVTVADSAMVTSVDSEKITDEGKAEDGTTLYTVDCVYPVLNGNVSTAGRDTANETIKNIILKNLEPIEADIKTAAEEFYAAVKEDESSVIDNYRPLSIVGEYKVTYLSDSIVSLYYNIGADFMGAHPMSYRDGITVDLTTGKEIAVSDVIIGDTNSVIKSAYEKAFAEKSEIFFPDAMNNFDEKIADIDFYLEDGSVVLFAPLYAVAPYAGGFIPVRLQYQKDDDTKTDTDWTVELTVSDVTPTGLKLTIALDGGAPKGELNTGSEFWLEKKDGYIWTSVDKLIKDEDTSWTMEAYIISDKDSPELNVSWSYLYGELPAGEYRIGKKISDLIKPGESEQRTFYAEFEIK